MILGYDVLDELDTFNFMQFPSIGSLQEEERISAMQNILYEEHLSINIRSVYLGH